MIRPIYLYGAEVLRQQALPANLDDKEGLKQLIEDLKDTLVESEGCGLAAPQIGVPLRVLVVDGDVMTDVYDYLAGFKRVMINPVILEQSSKTCEYNEGCLSVPGIYADVTRPDSITVQYYNQDFQQVTEKLDRFACRWSSTRCLTWTESCSPTWCLPSARKCCSTSFTAFQRER